MKKQRTVIYFFLSCLLVLFALGACKDNSADTGTDTSEENSSTTSNTNSGSEISLPAGVNVSITQAFVNESGTIKSFSISLKSQPGADVTIPISSADTSEVTVSQTSLIFTSSNWDSSQDVIINGVNDSSFDGGQQVSINIGAATSSDSKYSGLDSSDDITVYNFDNEFALSDTGQSSSYTSSRGEDSDYSGTSLSFTDNGNSTITDNNTGLTWQQQSDSTKRSWADASAYCSNLSLGGFSDWRLPKKMSLVSIVNFGTFAPAISSSYFTSTSPAYYWSSNPESSTYSIAISFWTGHSSKDANSNTEYVRCVRGHQFSSSFKNLNNGTILDLKTKLIWQKNGDNNYRTWGSALSYCENLSLAGKSDWRLPNVRELASIMDNESYTPAINSIFTNFNSAYWSSTTYVGDTTNAWYVSSTTGNNLFSAKINYTYVKCVRTADGS